MEWAQPRTHSKRVAGRWGRRPTGRFCPRVSSFGGGQNRRGAEGRVLPAGLHAGSQLFVSPALCFTCVKSRLQHYPGPKRLFSKENEQLVLEI